MTNQRELPILSIVVPTKNRPDTLRVLVDAVLSWEATNIELVIHDNSDCNDQFREVLNKYMDDPRFRYTWEPRVLSAVENSDLAVSNAHGEYLTFIGDDDGVLRQIVGVVEWMKAENVDSLYCNIGNYTWPDMVHAVPINNQFNGVLVDQVIHGKFVFLDPANELELVLRHGAQSMFRIPRLYQGVTCKKVLDILFEQLGTYFPGPAADMANAVAMNPYIKRHVYTDIPFIVSGQSRKSMSGQNSIRQHQGDIRKEKSLPADTFGNWSDTIPKYWCAPTIWAEAALKALQRTKREDKLISFGFARMYACCLSYSKSEFYPLVFQSMCKNRGFFDRMWLTLWVGYYMLCIAALRGKILAAKFVFKAQGEKFQTIEGALLHLEAKMEGEHLGKLGALEIRPT